MTNNRERNEALFPLETDGGPRFIGFDEDSERGSKSAPPAPLTPDEPL